MSGNDLYTYYTVANAEFSGVLDKYNVMYYNRIIHIYDYHLFIRYGDKVYMDVKGVGDIVISFDELQKNKHWLHYYDLSLMLTNNTHLLIKDLEYSSHYGYGETPIYQEPRVWSIDTAYIDGSYDAKTKKVVDNEYNCYYKINPFDVEKMNCASQYDLNIFTKMYMSRYEIHSRTFEKKSVYYYTFVFDYCVRLMEKELDELSAIFEDKKNMANLVALNEMKGMDGDVLRIIYISLISDKSKYDKYIDEICTIEMKSIEAMMRILWA